MIQRRNQRESIVNKGRQSRAEEQMVECFEELLNRPAPSNPRDIEAAPTDLPIDVTLPTIEEIRMVIRQVKSGKAAGSDNIPAEALKSDIEATATVLHFLNRNVRRKTKYRWAGKKNTSSGHQKGISEQM